jgi:hypothetical protein
MPADLVSNDAIPQLAARIDSPAMLRVLRHIQQVGFILNGQIVNQSLFTILQRLADLGLVDPGYADPTDGKPFIWVGNGNGQRVLRHFEASPLQNASLESKVTVHPRARTALESLSEGERQAVLVAVEMLQSRDPASWPGEEVSRLIPDQPVYLLRVSPDLRAFIRILDSGSLELFDIVPEETLRLFRERYGDGDGDGDGDGGNIG